MDSTWYKYDNYPDPTKTTPLSYKSSLAFFLFFIMTISFRYVFYRSGLFILKKSCSRQLRNSQASIQLNTLETTTPRYYPRTIFPRTIQPCTFPKTWNELSEHDIKSISNKNAYNKSLKKLFLDRLDPDFKCNRLLCPFCHLSNPN